MKLYPYSLCATLPLLLVVGGCSNVLCGAGTVDVDGECIGIDDVCDDGFEYVDGQCVAECTSGQTRQCGTNEGECVVGTQTCVDNAWAACQGGVEPSDELCDGLDNDCDGVADNSMFDEVCDGVDNDCDDLVDEGVMSVKQLPQEVGVGSVAPIGDGFAMGLWDDNGSSVTLFDGQGNKTGEVLSLGTGGSGFGSMFPVGDTVWVVHSLHGESEPENKLEVLRVSLQDGDLSLESRGKTDDSWVLSGAFTGNRRPQISSVLGFLLIGTGSASLQGIVFGSATQADGEPWSVEDLSAATRWDIANVLRFAWIAGSDIRIGTLGFPGDEISILDDKSAGEGSAVGVASNTSGDENILGIAFIDSAGKARVSELGSSLDCINNGLCKFNLGSASGLIDLVHRHEAWFVAAGEKTFVISRDGQELVPAFDRTGIDDIDDTQLAHNGLTTAIIDSDVEQNFLDIDPLNSAVTFIGCLDAGSN